MQGGPRGRSSDRDESLARRRGGLQSTAMTSREPPPPGKADSARARRKAASGQGMLHTKFVWAVIAVFVPAALWIAGPPDVAGWIAGLCDWAVLVPLVVLIPIVTDLTRLIHKSTGKTKDRLGFSDPLAYLRILRRLFDMLMHPWHWITARLLPLNGPISTERECFTSGMAEWVIYTGAGHRTDVKTKRRSLTDWVLGHRTRGRRRDTGRTEGQSVTGWALARRPLDNSQQYTICVAEGVFNDDDNDGFSRIRDLAAEIARKSAYTSLGVWAVVIFPLAQIGGAYMAAVGVLWILAVSALLLWWWITRMQKQQGPVGSPPPEPDDT